MSWPVRGASSTPTVMVTGGAGFIGSALVRKLVGRGYYRVLNVDKLTYAGNLDSLESVASSPLYQFRQVDICDAAGLRELFDAFQPSGVVHLAAESHVDRSIDGPREFLTTNVVGTFTLLEETRRYWLELNAHSRSAFRLVHVSTDEVYGSLGETGLFTEDSPYQPNSPYSASKAASDHFVRAWYHTFKLPVVTTNCSNNYGPFQFPEKLIPLVIQRAISEKSIPVYGRGENIRDWLYVDDHAEALITVLEKGRPGETYNIGARCERANIEVVRELCTLLDELQPARRPHAELITFVQDRPGHDMRYAIDPTKIESELGWRPRESFSTGLRKTVQWYLSHQGWCDRIQSGAYRQERLGLREVSLP